MTTIKGKLINNEISNLIQTLISANFNKVSLRIFNGEVTISSSDDKFLEYTKNAIKTKQLSFKIKKILVVEVGGMEEE